MTKIYVQPGNHVTFANAGSAISAGDIVPVGSLIGVAEVDIAATSGNGTVFIGRGVVTAPKDTAVAWTNGALLVWDVSTGKFDTAEHCTEATGDIVNNAVAFGAAAQSDTTGKVLINCGVSAIT